jgi:hypothetical protein
MVMGGQQLTMPGQVPGLPDGMPGQLPQQIAMPGQLTDDEPGELATDNLMDIPQEMLHRELEKLRGEAAREAEIEATKERLKKKLEEEEGGGNLTLLF